MTEYPLKKLTKEDCGQKISVEESQKILLDMLDCFAEFCDSHNLRYYLSGGTLLGAIRHKGFIPWDDDIDVNMPRPDIEKLYDITKGMLGKYMLAEPDKDMFSRCCECYRLYSQDAVIESYSGGTTKRHPVYFPVFMDIFPIEGLPEGERKTKLHYTKLVALRKMCRSSSLTHLEGKNFCAHIFHVVSAIPAKIVGYRRWSEYIQKTAKKYKFDEQKYVGVMTAPVHTTNEKVLKSEYIKSVDVMFEGRYYHSPGNYDTYLTQLYGDYMKMPPIEKQKSHHVFNVYWRKK